MTRQAVLFSPGDEKRMVEKSLTSDADMVILDIEDAVAPVAKDEACETIRETLLAWDEDDIEVEVAVRINPLGVRGREDVGMIAEASDKIENVVLPKARGPETVDDLSELLDDHGFDAMIHPLIEHPQALQRIEEIAGHPDVDAMEFGAEDFTTELGGIHTDERTEILYARQKVVVAAEAAGIDAIDMAWPDFRDEEGLRRNAEQAVDFGYDGKSAIHPVQIGIIRDVFIPDPERVEWAERVVERAKEAEAEGKVVFQIDGEMIDPPLIDRAHDILQRAGVGD